MVMAGFLREDLRHSYNWNTPEDYCRDISGFPEAERLNCMEGYEVLHFINRYLEDIGWVTKISFNNVESIIKTRRPIFLQSHSQVKFWLDGMLRK